MMKPALAALLCLASFAFFSTAARAGSLDNFSLTATYDSSTSSSSFSGPGDTITMNFSMPIAITPFMLSSPLPITVDFGGVDTSVSGEITFIPGVSPGGLFNVDFNSDGHAYEWQFAGPQSYNSSDNLLLGDFAIDGGNSFLLQDGNIIGSFDSGHVSVTSGAPTPEPAPLMLFATGLLGLGLAIRHRIAWEA